MVNEIHGYVFVWDHVGDFEWSGTENRDEQAPRYSASDLASRIKADLEDPEALSAKEVHVLTNLTKAQIIEEMTVIKDKAISLKKEFNIDLGFIMVVVGFMKERLPFLR